MWKISSVNIRAKKKKEAKKNLREKRKWCKCDAEKILNLTLFFLDSWNLLVCFFDECRTSHRTEWNRTRTNFMSQNHVRNARKSCEHCVSVVAWIVREKRKRGARTRYTLQLFFRLQVQSRNPTKKTFSFVRHRRRRNKKFITMMGKYQGEMCLNLNTIWESTLWVKQNQQQQHQWREEAQTSKRFKWSEKKGREFSSLFSSFLLCVVFFVRDVFYFVSVSPPLAFRYRCRRQSVCVSPRASRILCCFMHDDVVEKNIRTDINWQTKRGNSKTHSRRVFCFVVCSRQEIKSWIICQCWWKLWK